MELAAAAPRSRHRRGHALVGGVGQHALLRRNGFCRAPKNAYLNPELVRKDIEKNTLVRTFEELQLLQGGACWRTRLSPP